MQAYDGTRWREDDALKRIAVLCVILLALAGNLMPPAAADLDAYLKKPEPAYRWEKRGQTAFAGCAVYDLHLVSQVWQGNTWEHRLQIYRPENLDHPNFCVLLNTGGSGGERDYALCAALAKSSGCVFAVLYNIPMQPLYGGKTEDALVVYTWQKYLETGDESWPLHFPMAKAVLKAMDAVQAFCKEANLPPIKGFLITGASKRGWTTWLAGASRDPRIKAIAPMVIDTLNVAAQIPHQLQAFGKASEQIEDYTQTGMLDAINTPQGKRLMELEDPYSYRDRLTLPKLIINGTNDRYWAQDALNLYWDGLKGPKWVLYVPNSGHGLEDRQRVFDTLGAFARMVASGQSWPKMKWEYVEKEGRTELRMKSDIAPESARLFRVHAPTQDFRNSKWTFEPMEASGRSFVGSRENPKEGYAAIYGEATYKVGGKTFTLSTQIKILGPR
jgi:PhoPQ-activated pathogenicity-related protein